MVEFFDFGKRDIDLGTAGSAARGNQLRQSVQSLRAEYQIHIWRAFHDLRAFLARDTAADTDQEIGLSVFQMPDSGPDRETLFPAPFRAPNRY